jgi:hypothetical protein
LVPKRILARVAAALALAGVTGAQATTYNFPGSTYQNGDSGTQGYDYSNISAAPAGYPGGITGTVLTGGDKLVAGATTLDAYCVDLSDYIYIGSNLDYTLLSDSNPATAAYLSTLYTGANGAATLTSLEHLASNAYSQVTNADTSAAFQIAVWDIAFGQGVSGFTVAANGTHAATVNADVSTFLNLANEGGPITEQLTLLQDDGTNGGMIQNLVTFTPVPLPAAGWLMISGLSVLGAALRRRRA